MHTFQNYTLPATLIFILSVCGCKSEEKPENPLNPRDTITRDNTKTDRPDTLYRDSISISPKFYANERFRDVTVEKTGDSTFVIRGKGQIFEANFGWVIEDGHNELKQGYAMTDAGAPEWGNFSFTVTAAKRNPNSTLTLILFESSPKDGSRQYELPLRLY